LSLDKIQNDGLELDLNLLSYGMLAETLVKAGRTLARQTVYAMPRNLACQWRKNSWQSAWGCMAIHVRWSSACHVVAKISKCSKIIFKSVTTCLYEIVKCTCV